MWVTEVHWRYKCRENKVQTKETKGKHHSMKPLTVKGFRNKKTQNKILGFVPLGGQLSNRVVMDLLEFVQVMKNNKTRLQHFFEYL